jgi:PAS domain S-box-containing protein
VLPPDEIAAELQRLGRQTDLARRRQESRDSEQRHRSLFENMPNGYAHCRVVFEGDLPRDIVFLEVNRAFEGLTGLKDVVGKRISEAFPGIRESHPALFETCGRVATTGRTESFEVFFEPLAAWLFTTVYSTERGYFVAVFHDITYRKRAESSLEARIRMLSAAAAPNVPRDDLLQQMLDEIEEQTGSAIAFYHILEADQETLSLQAWSTNTLRTMCTAEGKGRHYDVSRAGVWVECIRTRAPVVHNDYASLADRKGLPPGHVAVVRELVVPILRGGRIAAIVGVGNKPTAYDALDTATVQSLGQLSWEVFERIRAVDELQAAHAELERRTQELAEANRELTVFNYSISHDLRAPLRSIAGFSDLLLTSHADQLDDKGSGHLRRIAEGAARLELIIDGILHLSRIAQRDLERRDTNLTAIAAAIARELREEQPDRRAALEIQDGVSAFADAKIVEVALENLLRNAWKFTALNPDARIEFGSLEQEGRTVYFVRDNGVGFDQSQAARLFIPFQRLHTTKEFEGTGIGLATVARAIRLHGGTIWAEGTKGAGATFFFTLG